MHQARGACSVFASSKWCVIVGLAVRTWVWCVETQTVGVYQRCQQGQPPGICVPWDTNKKTNPISRSKVYQLAKGGCCRRGTLMLSYKHTREQATAVAHTPKKHTARAAFTSPATITNGFTGIVLVTESQLASEQRVPLHHPLSTNRLYGNVRTQMVYRILPAC